MRKETLEKFEVAAQAPVGPSPTDLGLADGAVLVKGATFVADDAETESAVVKQGDEFERRVYVSKPLDLGEVGSRDDDAPSPLKRGPRLF